MLRSQAFLYTINKGPLSTHWDANLNINKLLAIFQMCMIQNIPINLWNIYDIKDSEVTARMNDFIIGYNRRPDKKN
ncbi:hypothetical protein MXB_4388 [Myxobolus squamalis]|nr:hypothetical protein MXB_4388 [Myxobolus squamalis]